MDEQIVQGRVIKPEDLIGIRQLMAAHPQWGRYHLSIHLAQQWKWCNGAGQLKDMAARSLLLKLERRGLLLLPPRKRSGAGNHKACKVEGDPEQPWELFPPVGINSALAQVLPLQVIRVENPPQRRIFSLLLQHHHYLGYYRPVGENMPYLIQTPDGRLLGCALFGAAAWKCAPRDRFIGWSDGARQEHLQWVANNMRLLLFPWVRVPHLPSHVLRTLVQRVSPDWQRKYGHPIFLLETFVEPERFAGTSYRAANWTHVGVTQGRGRQGASPRIRSTSIKDVYVFPLDPRFREHLRAASKAQPDLSSATHPAL